MNDQDKFLKTIFYVPKMDCPSEERIIRMCLEKIQGLKKLDFNIPERKLVIIHEGNSLDILNALIPLGFGAVIHSSSKEQFNELEIVNDTTSETKLLTKLLVMNFGMFLLEFSLGIWAESMGLISDSFDMLADSGVYLISLYAVGKSLTIKKRSALANGILQILIGAGIVIETSRRFIHGSDPEPTYMILISLIALVANTYCLVLLSKHRDGEVHLKASYICSSTDVMANIGVVIAGTLVALTKSPVPDLIIGIIITAIVLRGAISILKIAR